MAAAELEVGRLVGVCASMSTMFYERCRSRGEAGYGGGTCTARMEEMGGTRDRRARGRELEGLSRVHEGGGDWSSWGLVEAAR